MQTVVQRRAGIKWANKARATQRHNVLEESEDMQEICDDPALLEYDDGFGVDVENLFAGRRDKWFGGRFRRQLGLQEWPTDSEFEGSFDSEEEREISEDVDYLKAIRDGRLSPDETIFSGMLI